MTKSPPPESGEKRPVWILCNPRCGSSYLCQILNDTEKFAPAQQKAFGEWLKRYQTVDAFSKDPVPFNKCIYRQFHSLFGELSREWFESILPGIRYILLHRRDVYAQTVSLYFARLTGRYHIFSESERENYLKIDVDFDEALMRKLYHQVIRYRQLWSKFLSGAECFELYYEDLVKDPSLWLGNIAEFLDISLSPEEIQRSISGRRLLSSSRPETKQFIERLKLLVPTDNYLT